MLPQSDPVRKRSRQQLQVDDQHSCQLSLTTAENRRVAHPGTEDDVSADNISKVRILTNTGGVALVPVQPKSRLPGVDVVSSRLRQPV